MCLRDVHMCMCVCICESVCNLSPFFRVWTFLCLTWSAAKTSQRWQINSYWSHLTVSCACLFVCMCVACVCMRMSLCASACMLPALTFFVKMCLFINGNGEGKRCVRQCVGVCAFRRLHRVCRSHITSPTFCITFNSIFCICKTIINAR